MKVQIICNSALAVLSFVGLTVTAGAQEHTTTDVGTLDKESAEKAFAKRPYSPYAGRDFPTRPLFGDTHTHTSFSFDAGAFGCRLGPKDAYRLARGEEITASSGQQVKLSRPLDFLVVSDHSDNMGFFPQLPRASGSTASMPRTECAGSPSMKPRRSKATASRIRSSRPTTSSRTSSAGTKATRT